MKARAILFSAIVITSSGCSLAIKTGLGSIQYDTGDTRLKAEKVGSIKGENKETRWSLDTKADDDIQREPSLIFVDPVNRLEIQR